MKRGNEGVGFRGWRKILLLVVNLKGTIRKYTMEFRYVLLRTWKMCLAIKTEVLNLDGDFVVPF